MAADNRHEEFMAFLADSDDHSFGVLRAIAQRQGWGEAVVQGGGLELFLQFADSGGLPRLVMLDLDGQQDVVEVLRRLIEEYPQSRFIALGSANDVSLYREMVQVGVADYLVKPLLPEVAAAAIRHALRAGDKAATAAASDKPPATTIVVLGVRGGVGASTLAVNLAWLLAHQHQRQTAMLDLDLQYGTVSLALDVEPGRGLREALLAPGRLDSLIVASSMVAIDPHLSVLSAEESIEETYHFDSTALAALLEELRNSFKTIVVDMPRHLFAAQRRVLAEATAILLVTDQSLAGIRDVTRLKTALKMLGASGEVLVIVSRQGGDRSPQLDAASFERGIGGKPDATIPEDTKAMAQAANQGKPLAIVAPNSPAARVVLALAARLAGGKEKDAGATATSGGLLGKLLGTKPAAKA